MPYPLGLDVLGVDREDAVGQLEHASFARLVVATDAERGARIGRKCAEIDHRLGLTPVHEGGNGKAARHQERTDREGPGDEPKPTPASGGTSHFVENGILAEGARRRRERVEAAGWLL